MIKDLGARKQAERFASKGQLLNVLALSLFLESARDNILIELRTGKIRIPPLQEFEEGTTR